MKDSNIYEQFRIPKHLQNHMLRVASVGWYISEHWKQELDSESIIATLLFHDLGNLLKFDLDKGLDLFDESERDLNHWVNVKQEISNKYSDHEHEATQLMAEEIGVSDRVLFLLNNMGS